MKRADGKLRSLQKNQSFFSTTCQYPPLSGPIRRSTPSAFSLKICFSTVEYTYLLGKIYCPYSVTCASSCFFFLL